MTGDWFAALLRSVDFDGRTTAAGHLTVTGRHSADTHARPVRQAALSAPDGNQLGNLGCDYRHGVL